MDERDPTERGGSEPGGGGTAARVAPLWFALSALLVVGVALLWRVQQGQEDGGEATAAALAGEGEGDVADDGTIDGGTGAAPSGEGETAMNVRSSPFAGAWYPAERSRLHADIQGYRRAAEPYHGPRPLAVIGPHAGYRYSGGVAGWSYAALADERYDRVFILGPSHRYSLAGLGIGPWTHYETPLGRVPVDTAAVERLAAHDGIAVVDGVDDEEHSVEMQVPFLQVAAMGARIVPIVVGRLDRDGVRAAAAALREEVGPGDLVVVSSDFTHWGRRFGYTPDLGDDPAAGLEALDMGAFEALVDGVDAWLDYKRDTDITVCGYLPLAILRAMLPDDTRLELRHYDTSGAMTGDYDNSVSYVSAVATGSPWSGRGADDTTWRLGVDEQRTLLRLARDTIAARLRDEPLPSFDDYAITDTMQAHAGGFVTLTIGEHLRGCIGEIPSTRPIHEVVRDHALDAAFRDPRFAPLQADELDRIEIEISVLTPPREVPSADDIVLGRDGIYLIKGMRRAVYLPQVAVEQGWTLEETLASLARKAGLAADAWREGARFETFQAQVFHE